MTGNNHITVCIFSHAWALMALPDKDIHHYLLLLSRQGAP